MTEKIIIGKEILDAKEIGEKIIVVEVGAGHHNTAELEALIRAAETDREVIIVGVDDLKEVKENQFAPPPIPIKRLPEIEQIYEPFIDEDDELFGTRQKKNRKGFGNKKYFQRKPKQKKTHRIKRKK